LKEEKKMNETLVKLSYVFFSVVTRVILLTQIGFSTFFLASFYDEYFYYVLLLGALVIIVDGIYVLAVRDTKEFRW
jgi:hypothetical protein